MKFPIYNVPPDLAGGLLDVAEKKADCTVTDLEMVNGVSVGISNEPVKHTCKIMASKESGTLSVSVLETGMMVTVRMADALSVMNETSRFHQNNCVR